MSPAIQHIIAIIAVPERGILFAESVTSLPSDADMLAEGIASIKGKQRPVDLLIVAYYVLRLI
jgi:hypothetical protein